MKGVVVETVNYSTFKEKQHLMQQMKRKIGKGLKMSYTDNLIICEYKERIN